MAEQPVPLVEAIIDRGRRLAESTYKEWFTEEDGSPSPLDEKTKAFTAYLMEVERAHIQGLSEETRTAQIGSWEKYVFPMIRAVFPNLIATELVTVQPMQGPTSLIFFMDYRAGSKKGTTNVGDVLIGARTGQAASTSYSGEDITGESGGIGNGGSTFSTGQLGYFPLRPVSVIIIMGTGGTRQVWTDDGNGGLAANAGGTGTIDYATGQFTLAGIAAANYSSPITVTYNWASEGSLQVPQIDISITSVPVEAKPRKLRGRWSVEASAQMRAVHGTDTEQEVTTGMAEELRFDIDREIIGDLFSLAGQPDADTTDTVDMEYTFYTTPPAGISFFQHKMTILDTFINHSTVIFQNTKRATANWIVCGTKVGAIIRSLPMFKPVAVAGSGVVFMGELQGQWKVYMDPFIDVDTFLIGHKGDSYLYTGYIYAPWIPIYFTPTIYLDDMIGRKGVLTEYAKKPVNALFYSKGVIVHGPQPT
jgi:hypothetical protein